MMTEKNTPNILTEKEHNEILNMFPEIIRESIKNCNNPLDETQIIVSLFSNKQVRIIFRKEINEFEDEDYVSYFHAKDIAEQVNHITIDWEVKFIKYMDLKNSDPNFIKINFAKIPDDCAEFINEQDMKNILSKINNIEAQAFQTWILKQSGIMKSAIKIKHKLELKNKDKIIENKNKQLDDKEKQTAEIAKRTSDAMDFFRKPVRHRGKIYIATSPDKQKIDAYKIGRTTGPIEKRLSSMQTSNPDIRILKDFNCNDVYSAEKLIHEYLFNLRLHKNKEYFFSYSIDRCIELVEKAVNFINDLTNTFDNDNTTLQTQYITDFTKKITLNKDERPLMKYKESETEMTIETSPERNLNQEFVDKFIKKTDDKKDYIIWTNLKAKYEEWFVSNSNETLPNAKLIKKYFEDYVFKCEIISSTSGDIKYRGWNKFIIIEI